MGMEEGGDTKRKMELFPQALADLQVLQDVLLELQSVQDPFPLAKIEEKGSTCHMSENWHLAEASHRHAIASKQWAKHPATARRCLGPTRRRAVVAPGWRPLLPGVGFVSSGASCWHFCSSPCYFGSLICLDFWSKAYNLEKGHKNGD